MNSEQSELSDIKFIRKTDTGHDRIGTESGSVIEMTSSKLTDTSISTPHLKKKSKKSRIIIIPT